eukprot:3493738-Pyramimonas_sp.AAC.1
MPEMLDMSRCCACSRAMLVNGSSPSGDNMLHDLSCSHSISGNIAEGGSLGFTSTDTVSPDTSGSHASGKHSRNMM